MSITKHLKITKEALEKYGYNGLGRLSFASLEETCNKTKSYHVFYVELAVGVGIIIGTVVTRL